MNLIDANLNRFFLYIQGGETFMYEYDWLGRVTGVILPSGETLILKSDVSESDGFQVTVSKPPTKLMVAGKLNKKISINNGKCVCVCVCGDV